MATKKPEHMKKSTMYVSIFHRGGKFICQMERLHYYTREGAFEYEYEEFFKITLNGNRPCKKICSKEDYEKMLKNLRATKSPSSDQPVEEKYKYGYNFSDSVLKDRDPYSHEWFGKKPPDIQETIDRFVKPPMTDEDYRRAYPCEVCKGTGNVLKFVKYGGHEVRFSRRGPECTTRSIFTNATCPACSGRGYDLSKVLRGKGLL